MSTVIKLNNPYEDTTVIATDGATGGATDDAGDATGNWPRMLQSKRAQVIYALLTVCLSLATIGIVGYMMALYWVLILDRSVKRNPVANVMIWVIFLAITAYSIGMLGTVAAIVWG